MPEKLTLAAVLPFLHGGGSNGKSVFLDVMIGILGLEPGLLAGTDRHVDDDGLGASADVVLGGPDGAGAHLRPDEGRACSATT